MICKRCQTELPDNARFCPACGARLNETTALANTEAGAVAVLPTISNQLIGKGCTVMLLSLGQCSFDTAVSLVSQLCGYSAADARLMVQSLPIALARNLTDVQANTLAQALCEYGLDISIYDANGWRQMESQQTSVWSQAGTLIASAASALGMLGIANRITRSLMRRWDYPYQYTGARPPVYRLNRAVQHRPVPRAPQPVPPHHSPMSVHESRPLHRDQHEPHRHEEPPRKPGGMHSAGESRGLGRQEGPGRRGK